MNRAVLICGVPPVRSIGAGRLAIELERQARSRADVRLLFTGNRSTVADAVRRRRWAVAAGAVALHAARRARQRVLAVASALRTAESVILLHPQSIGGRWCLDLIRRRRKPTWIYLLDSSFFCLRSYNHLAAENDACLRCVGGAWAAATEHNCAPYPAGHDCGRSFLQDLRALAADGRVRFMAQNSGQAKLAERHFGPHWPVPVVGMWTIDLEEVFGGGSATTPRRGHDSPRGYDVVFHGGDHHAKGFCWALDVARRLPAVKFLFPMAWQAAARWGERPPNCEFRPMTWESGLHAAVSAAAVTLVPSLWSAPVEGAMVKSIAAGRAVAAPLVESGFVADLPVGVVRLLGYSPEAAAADLETLLAEHWQPDPALLAEWKRTFRAANSPLLASMIHATITASLPSP